MRDEAIAVAIPVAAVIRLRRDMNGIVGPPLKGKSFYELSSGRWR
jgi:hypothetical protein